MDMLITIVVGAAAVAGILTARRYRRVIVVNEGHAGLRYRNGRLVETLEPGLHIRYGWRQRVEQVDTRVQALEMPGQELLTLDSVTLKLSLAVEEQVIDAGMAARGASSWQKQVYTALASPARRRRPPDL